MASDVDISNLALSYVGDGTRLSSLTPIGGSAQAGYCAQFFPLALGEFVDAHEWDWAIKREPLVETTNPTTNWLYAYAAPATMSRPIEVIWPQPEHGLISIFNDGYFDTSVLRLREEPFEMQRKSADTDDGLIILTNVPGAILRYRRIVESTAVLRPPEVEALARLLASMLAGPLIKGEKGRKEAAGQMEMYLRVALPMAKENDSMGRATVTRYMPSGIRAR